MKHRLPRVSEVIKRELGEIIPREVQFAATLVTVQHVDLTPDLRQAFIDVSVIGSAAEKEAAIASLEAHRAALQSALSKRVVIKFTPQLHFRLDESLERGARVIELLDEIDLPENEPDDEEK